MDCNGIVHCNSLIGMKESAAHWRRGTFRHSMADYFDPDRFPIHSLLPQSGAMLLVDRILSISDEKVTVSLEVRKDGLFSTDGVVPAWVGIEYMAQAVAAWSGYQCLRRGEPIRIGLLLGTRHYQSNVAEFACGTELEVWAGLNFQAANDMSVFDCEIRAPGIHATAMLNVLLPKNIEPFLQKDVVP